MRKLIYILLGLLVFATSMQGQISTVTWFNTAYPSAAYPSVLNDGNTVLWLENDGTTDNFTFDDGDSISQWNDLSGNGNHLQQGTGANMPKWYADSVVFDGVNDVLFNISFTVNDTATAYIVVNQIAYGSEDRLLFMGSTMNIAMGSTGSGYTRVDAGGNIEESGYSYGTWYIITARFVDSGTSGIQKNGDTETTGASGAISPSGEVYINSGSYPARAQINAVIVRDGEDSSQSRGEIIDYLNSLYSIY